MKGNNTLTTQWYQHRQIVRCLSLIPDDGIDKELFIFSLNTDLQAEARSCIQQGKYILQEGARIRPLSPLLFCAVRPTQELVVDFLAGLYMVLEEMIEQYKQPETQSLEEEAAELCRQADRLRNTENLSELEQKLLKHIAPLINQLKIPRIGGLDHLKDEVKKVRNAVGVVYFKRFGDERMNAIRAFHEGKGKDICAVFYKALDTIPLDPVLQENMLDLMVQYYELTESMFEEMAAAAEKLLALQVERGAPAWILSRTHMKLSDGYMGSFKTNPKWLELSDYHLAKSCEYAHIAYEEEQKEETESAQEV